MDEHKRFPLILWGETEEFKKEYLQAEQRFHDISKRLYGRGFKCTGLGSLEMDADGFPVVWLNENMPLRAAKHCKNPEDAMQLALQHGDTGYWNLGTLERFIDGKGPIVQRAMWDLGYKRSTKNSARWVRRKKEDQKLNNYQNKSIEDITADRYESLLVLPNESAGANRTFGITVGSRGMIYAYLQVNPFSATRAEDLGWLATMLMTKGHIAKQQDGYRIEAKNVVMNENKGVYIKAVKPDDSYIECIWPVQTPMEKLGYLAEDLVSRVK